MKQLNHLTTQARKNYTHFLKFTNPKKDEYPPNLLSLLDSSRNRWLKLKSLNLIEVEKERLAWSLKMFPKASNYSSLLKLEAELQEIKEDIRKGEDNPLEYADALMCLFDSAGRDGIDAQMIYDFAYSKYKANVIRDLDVFNYFIDIRDILDKLKPAILSNCIYPHYYSEILVNIFIIANLRGVSEFSIVKAFAQKFEINKNRKWTKNPDNTYSHI